MPNFRLHQRVCKVDWRNGEAYIRFGRVTRVTSRTYYVDDSKTRSAEWSASWRDALNREYTFFLGLYKPQTWGRLHPKGWTFEIILNAICQLRRLERRLSRRNRQRKGDPNGISMDDGD